jgi:hypothetical protein
MDVLKLWFKHLDEVIASGDVKISTFINKWIAYICQHAARTTTALILKGIQGSGKNAFTDVLSQLFRGFSNGDITDLDDLTGNNSGIENKVFIALNEARNAGEARFANFDKLKAFVVAPYIDIAEKYVKKHKAENVLNIVFTTNNDYPVKIENGDRRYLVLNVCGKYKHDKQYFNEYWKACSGSEFFDNLLTYYMNYPTSFDEIREPPMTDEKQDIIDASKSPVDLFITAHFQQFFDGWKTDEVRAAKPYDITSEKAFTLGIASKCKRIQRREGTAKPYYYQLLPEWVNIYRPSDYVDPNNSVV